MKTKTNPFAKQLRDNRYKNKVVPDKKKKDSKKRYKLFELLERFR